MSVTEAALRRRRWGLAGASALSVLILLGALELAARLFGRHDDARSMEAQFIETSLQYLEPCFEVRRGTLVGPNAGMGPDVSPRRISLDRTEGVARMAFVGESSSRMLSDSVERLLRLLPCCAEVEVLACGQPGSGLEHLERRLTEVLRYSPDVVVVTFGHNLMFQFELRRAALLSKRVWGSSALLGWFKPALPASPAPPVTYDARIGEFERVLRNAAMAAASAAVRVVITPLPTNLWMPPMAPVEGELPLPLVDAAFAERTAGPRRAAEVLEPVAEVDSRGAFEAGILLARAGEGERANELLARAVRLDPGRMRAPAEVNAMLRRVAIDSALEVVDLEGAAVERAPLGIPGWETFADNCHLRADGFDDAARRVVAVALLPTQVDPQQLQPIEGTRSGSDPLLSLFSQVSTMPPNLQAMWLRAAELQIEARIRMGETGLVEALVAMVGNEERGAVVISAVAEGLWRAGHRDEARALNERARDGGDLDAWVRLGLYELELGDRSAARAAWERARDRAPTRRDVAQLLELEQRL